ncbi:hypothetical protein [Colwellia hornerae]|uniref:hypothetical protein n=1 Tax=Colwellia hornerae TaxID=89402 RepID=UPI001479609E|nr:hypothetical protein [Colwellia hornerae]
MNKKIIILVHEGFFTSHLFEYQNINLDFIINELVNEDFNVEVVEYSALAKQNYTVENDTIYWTGSHQNVDVKQYINDVLLARFIGRENLVPKLETVISHENKGMQGILAGELGINLISQDYHCTTTVPKDYLSDTVVFKSLGGAGSIGVSLAKNKKQYQRKIRMNLLLNTTFLNIKEMSKNVLRRLLRRNSQANYLRKKARFVSQLFVKELLFDYKVLVLGEHVYFLKRYVRKDDFRASGSGQFEFEGNINPKLIQFAFDCKDKLNVPYCSLDLIEYGQGEIGLIEFQTVHFGPYTLLGSDCYYDKCGRKVLLEVKSETRFEEELVSSLIQQVK